jgi:hypothetical protein
MQQITIEQVEAAYQRAEEWRKFNEWAIESRSTIPFVYLALHWHAGYLTIAEGRRIERDQQIAQFLSR